MEYYVFVNIENDKFTYAEDSPPEIQRVKLSFDPVSNLKRKKNVTENVMKNTPLFSRSYISAHPYLGVIDILTTKSPLICQSNRNVFMQKNFLFPFIFLVFGIRECIKR